MPGDTAAQLPVPNAYPFPIAMVQHTEVRMAAAARAQAEGLSQCPCVQ